ncbi:related to HD domain-containing protein C4G3.17 [Armillaria ostoyae]|uniref:5'-deoxynucleotidase n=1 Tax=Armillaria ostoyae TaxID=47428 RepID=A0A284R3U2_ARMOS|nr:related to HD domain-containing protein C4G3.17 [Armillaria ostoyae]
MSSSTRVFPPLYTSSGDDSADRLAFFHILERLKTQKRTGWIDHGIGRPESISDHMHRMAVLAMCTSDEKLDIPKYAAIVSQARISTNGRENRCVMMCVVHDLAEAQVGDITPREGISRAEKLRLEEEAMHNFIHEMLHNSPAAQRIEALWREYEDGKTPEARFVKDRFELASQAFEYERTYTARNLQTFFDTSLPKIRHTEVREWSEDLLKERKELWKAIEPEQPAFNSLL